MAEWVEKGSLQGPPGEIPDVSDFLRDGDVSSAISGSSDKVASDKAVKDYVDSVNSALDGKISAEATSREEQDEVLLGQISGKANVEHSHEINDVTGLQDSLDSKASLVHTHSTSDVTGLDSALAGKSDNGHKHVSADVTDLNDKLDAKANVTHTHAIDDVTNLRTTLDGKAASKHSHETSDVTGLDTKISEIEGDVAGKADSAHTHDAADVVSGTLAVDRIPSIPDSKIENVSASKLVGTIPTGNLPSYVDDVIEADDYDSLPPTGEAGKVYVDKETNKTYRWGGSAYVEISASLALGETSATAFRGDHGKTAYDHAQAKGSEFATGFYKIATNAEGHVISATAVAKGDITALGVPAQDTTYVDATGSASGLMSASDKSKLDGIAEGADKLPDGGTDGQVLTKTASGEQWQDAPEQDLSGYALKDDGYIRVDENSNLVRFDKTSGTETNVAYFNIKTNTSALGNIEVAPQAGIKVTANVPLEMSVTSGDGGYAKLTSNYDTDATISTNGKLVIKDKSVTSITDDASSGSSTALATAKAVKDYVDDHGMPSVVPINKGGTGVTTEDALVQKIFKSASTPKASATQYGVVKFASDADFKAYMGIS